MTKMKKENLMYLKFKFFLCNTLAEKKYIYFFIYHFEIWKKNQNLSNSYYEFKDQTSNILLNNRRSHIFWLNRRKQGKEIHHSYLTKYTVQN